MYRPKTSNSLSVKEHNPFGLKMGMSLEDVKTLAPDITYREEHDVYTSYVVPAPHPLFDLYYFKIDRVYGLYSIQAGTRSIEDEYGNLLREQFNDLAARLSPKYGNSRFKNVTVNQPIWIEKDEWLASIFQGEREYYSYWSKDSKGSMGKDLLEVHLSLVALSHTSGILLLKYVFTNSVDVASRLSKSYDDVL